MAVPKSQIYHMQTDRFAARMAAGLKYSDNLANPVKHDNIQPHLSRVRSGKRRVGLPRQTSRDVLQV